MANVSAVDRTGLDISDEVMISLQSVDKWFGQFHVLKGINLTVYKGERIVICGPSGSGKSTLIRCINRLEEHQKGTIIVDGIELNQDLKHIEQVRREVGMVFQHFNLFPHLTVLENLTLAPTASSSWTAARSSSRPIPRTSSTTRAPTAPSCSSARSCITEGGARPRRASGASTLLTLETTR